MTTAPASAADPGPPAGSAGTAPVGVDAPVGVAGIGVDAVDVVRFRALLARRPTLEARLFTPEERTYADRYRDRAPRLAARFAAKEATLKALGAGIGAAPFHDIAVVRADDGAPSLAVSGRAAELARRRGVDRWHLSLTHTDDLAVASVVAEHGAPGPAPPPPAAPPP